MAQRTRATNALLAILVTILVGWLLHVGAPILQPLVIALLLASMLQPVVRALSRFWIPPFVTVVVLVAALSFGIFRVGVFVQRQATDFLSDSGTSVERLQSEQELSEQGEQIRRIADQGGLPLLIRLSLVANTGDPGGVQPGTEDGEVEEATLNTVLSRIDSRIRQSVNNRDLADYLIESRREIDFRGLSAQVLGTGVGFMKNLLLVVIYMLFIFAEQAVFRRKILSVAGRRRAETERALDSIAHGVQRYLGVKTIASLATGALCYVGLRWLGMQQAELFGFLTFLLNYIPTFGSIIAGILVSLTALAVDTTWHMAAGVALIYLSINLVIGSYIEPKVLGRELNLSPLVVVICVVVWAGLWGPVGTFLAVPITSAIQIILASHKNTRPIAILLSSGPPREGRRKRKRKGRRPKGPDATSTPPPSKGSEGPEPRGATPGLRSVDEERARA